MFQKTGAYVVNTAIKSDQCNDGEIWATTKYEGVRCYTYNDAVAITGHGPYSVLLLFGSCISLLGMVLDMFAISGIISVAACDLHLGSKEEKLLMSVPFLGAILTAYLWGYFTDTKGRRKIMLLAMWVSFGASCLAAFSTHWIMMAVLKFLSVSFSACTQSTSYTMIGESCGAKVTAVYYFILTSIIHVGCPLQMALHYYTLTLDFSIDLGIMHFVPWRFLAIILALPLGVSAVCLHFIYESPKFLANAGREDEAVVILEKIWKRNRQPGIYPVKKLILNEEHISKSEVPLLQSLWNQTAPLFMMPLLTKTLLLFGLILIIYLSCGGFFIWLPFLADAFISGSLSNQTSSNQFEGLCTMISEYAAMKNNNDSTVSCVPKSNLILVGATAIQGLILIIINCAIGLLANRRKLLMIIIFFIPTITALGCATLTSNIASIISYFTIFLTPIASGIVMSYFVDLYPTSYRGMATCLGLMVARFATIGAVNLIGSLILDHCHVTFYMTSAIFFSGVILSCFLPPDLVKKTN